MNEHNSNSGEEVIASENDPTPIEISENYARLAELSKDLAVARKPIQWKMSFGFWTALAVVSYVLFPELSLSCGWKWTITGIVVLASFFFVYYTVFGCALANAQDMKLLEYFRFKALEKMGEKPVNKNPVSLDDVLEILDAKRYQVVYSNELVPRVRWTPMALITVILFVGSLAMLWAQPISSAEELRKLQIIQLQKTLRQSTSQPESR